MLVWSAVAFAHPLHSHVVAGCVKDRVNPAKVGVLVPDNGAELGATATRDGWLYLSGELVYFAGRGDDRPFGSLPRATRATVDDAGRYGVVPYALVAYHTDCGVGGGASGVTMSRWRRLDRTREIPLDLPAAVDRLHAEVRAAVAADPGWNALLDLQRDRLRAPGVVQPDVLSEGLTWEGDHLLARFRVVRTEAVGGGCPGVSLRWPLSCTNTTALSTVTGWFTATVDRTGVVALSAEPLTGRVEFMPPAY